MKLMKSVVTGTLMAAALVPFALPARANAAEVIIGTRAPAFRRPLVERLSWYREPVVVREHVRYEHPVVVRTIF